MPAIPTDAEIGDENEECLAQQSQKALVVLNALVRGNPFDDTPLR